LDLIKDLRNGAVEVRFVDLSDEELRVRFWSFSEARAEYIKRFLRNNNIQVKATK